MNEVPGRLIREALQSGMPGGSAGCLDAETLAAWADNTLSRRERGAAEAHAAGCARCQAMLAAMARTAPPAVSRVWWRSPLGWMVPVTAAAAALLVWFELPRPARVLAPESSAFQSNAASPVPPPPPQSRDERVARADKDKDKNLKIETDKAIASPRQEKVEKEVFDTLAKASEPKPDAASVEQAPAPASREAAADAAAPPQSAAAGAPPAPAAAAPAPPRLASSAEAQKFALKDASASPARSALADTRRQLLEITISIANSRWRITAVGSVEHSTDGGSTWETQSTGVASAVTAGMAPSTSVCWLVGPRGLVLLSTDGRSWKRIAFPEMVDLTAVRAADDKTATVTTADGRMFTSSDGGTTWRR